MWVYSYDFESESGKALADALDAKRIKHQGSVFSGAASKIVINWGSSNPPWEVMRCRVINHPDAIKRAVNKRTALEGMQEAGIHVPDYTTDRAVANIWILNGFPVYARQKLEGSDGDGLSIHTVNHTLPHAKLYVKRVESMAEYRVNVAMGTTVGVQKKVRIPGKEVYNDLIKTTSGGYGFDLLHPDAVPLGVRPLAIKAVKALGLDFGGVDVVVTSEGRPYVLEVNTAPQLTPTMVNALADCIKRGLYDGI